jgi:hypothetical protein
MPGRSAMLLLLLQFSASICNRYSSTAPGEVCVTDATFAGCAADSNGGAVFLSHCTLAATLQACGFLNCSSVRSGGAVYFSGARLLLTLSSVSLCRAARSGPALAANCRSARLVHSIVFVDGASLGCAAQAGTLHFVPSAAAGSESVLERANVTGNAVAESGAAAVLDDCCRLRLRFCEIHSNAGSNCIEISTVRDASIRCLSVRSNSAHGRYADR